MTSAALVNTLPAATQDRNRVPESVLLAKRPMSGRSGRIIFAAMS